MSSATLLSHTHSLSIPRILSLSFSLILFALSIALSFHHTKSKFLSPFTLPFSGVLSLIHNVFPFSVLFALTQIPRVLFLPPLSLSLSHPLPSILSFACSDPSSLSYRSLPLSLSLSLSLDLHTSYFLSCMCLILSSSFSQCQYHPSSLFSSLLSLTSTAFSLDFPTSQLILSFFFSLLLPFFLHGLDFFNYSFHYFL